MREARAQCAVIGHALKPKNGRQIFASRHHELRHRDTIVTTSLPLWRRKVCDFPFTTTAFHAPFHDAHTVSIEHSTPSDLSPSTHADLTRQRSRVPSWCASYQWPYRTMQRPRAHQPLSMLKYDPIGTHTCAPSSTTTTIVLSYTHCASTNTPAHDAAAHQALL
jgi:hypothetical protein